MNLHSVLQSLTVTSLLNSASAANTAAASSSTTYVDVRDYEGDIMIVISPGAITGTATPDIQDATDAAGTGTASIAATEGAYTALAANTLRKYTINSNACRGFIRVINTVVTGPVAPITITMLGRPKSV